MSTQSFKGRAKRAASNYVRAEARVSATRLFHIDLLNISSIATDVATFWQRWEQWRRSRRMESSAGNARRVSHLYSGLRRRSKKLQELSPASRVSGATIQEWRWAFWDVLDWIIYYDGACFDEVSKEIVDRFSVYPFYQDEFRLILRRLADAARHLVFDEGVVLWQALGPEVMISKLTHWALAFDSLIFSDQKESMLGYTKVDEQVLNDDGFWLSLLPAQPAVQKDYQKVVLRNDVLGTQAEVACSCCNFVQALAEWQADTWNRYSCVLLHVQRYREEGLYLGTRHLQYPSLDGSSPDQGLFHVLRCCWNFAVQGGPVAICADESFWASGISRPFQAMKRVSVSL